MEYISVLHSEIRAKSKPGAKIVFVSGNFNVLHPGHLRIINFAAECGDFLVVGVHADGMPGTLLPEDVRCNSVQALAAVGHAFILYEPVEDFIAKLKPAIVVKGDEHRTRENVEKKVLELYGGQLLFCSGDSHYSYIDLLHEQIEKTRGQNARKKPNGYLSRHPFSAGDLRATVKAFSTVRVVVVGDLIIDEYVDCEPLGLSREDPTIVVTPILSKRFVGGAGIVAAHAGGLGAQASLFSIAGKDEAENFARKQLADFGVDCDLTIDDTRPTSLKQRFRSENKTLLRVSHLRQHAISDELVDKLAEKIEASLEGAGLLIFSDFNYGCLPQRLVDRISGFCAARDIPMAADSQTSSQLGDVSRFRGMMLLSPTEHEARMAMRDNQSGLVVIADQLRKKANVRHVIVTLGSEGIFVHSPTAEDQLPSDRLPALNPAPQDLAGAGDSLLTATALSLASGADIWQSAYLGSLAAACQVSRIGNLPLSAQDLLVEMAE